MGVRPPKNVRAIEALSRRDPGQNAEKRPCKAPKGEWTIGGKTPKGHTQPKRMLSEHVQNRMAKKPVDIKGVNEKEGSPERRSTGVTQNLEDSVRRLA